MTTREKKQGKRLRQVEYDELLERSRRGEGYRQIAMALNCSTKTAVANMGIKPKRTAYRSPWQNGVAERLVGSIRRELLDHVVVANENHLRRLLRDYQVYYSEDRCHLTLGKDPPVPRPIEPRPSPTAKVTRAGYSPRPP